MFHKSPKSGKQDSKRRSVRTEVQGELPVCPTLGTDGAGTSPGHVQPSQAVCLITGVRMRFGIALEAGYSPCNHSRFYLIAFKTEGKKWRCLSPPAFSAQLSRELPSHSRGELAS